MHYGQEGKMVQYASPRTTMLSHMPVCLHTHTNQAHKCPAPSDKTYSLIFFKLWLMISSWLEARTAEILGVQSSALHYTSLRSQFPNKQTHIRWPEVRDTFAQFTAMWRSHGNDHMRDRFFVITATTTNLFCIEHPKVTNSSSTTLSLPFRWQTNVTLNLAAASVHQLSDTRHFGSSGLKASLSLSQLSSDWMILIDRRSEQQLSGASTLTARTVRLRLPY